MLDRFVWLLAKKVHHWSGELLLRLEPGNENGASADAGLPRTGDRGSSPPAHWVALVRDRAPHLLESAHSRAASLRIAHAANAHGATARLPKQAAAAPAPAAHKVPAATTSKEQTDAHQTAKAAPGTQDQMPPRPTKIEVDHKAQKPVGQDTRSPDQGAPVARRTAAPEAYRQPETLRQAVAAFDPASFDSATLVWPKLSSGSAVFNQPESATEALLQWPHLAGIAAPLLYQPNLLHPDHRARVDAEQRDSPWNG